MPYSLIHCKTMRTGIHKGDPLVPFVESGDVIVLRALFAKSSARTGRFGNPIGRVSDGSFPYFCPYRNRVPARHERKNILLFQRGKTDCRGAKAPRNDEEWEKRIAAAVTRLRNDKRIYNIQKSFNTP